MIPGTLTEWNHTDHHILVRVWQTREFEFGWATPFEYGYSSSWEAACNEIETALFWQDEVECSAKN